ncbi:hypothetical protein D3C86_2112840 [compost metagenome]
MMAFNTIKIIRPLFLLGIEERELRQQLFGIQLSFAAIEIAGANRFRTNKQVYDRIDRFHFHLVRLAC